MVGAGPGRADLITLRGAEVLRTADCVICDKLVNPAMLRLARADAEIIAAPKRIGLGSFTQQQINELMVDKTREGKTVVRLKGGDPLIFGRGGEEARLLAEAGIEFEIVPGVTAASGAAGYAGLCLTDRQYNSQVVFVTGREAAGKSESNIDWEFLAGFGGTIVFYMGIGSLGEIAGRLMEFGMSSEVPAAVVADATMGSQRIVSGMVATIEQQCSDAQIAPPGLLIIGQAARPDERLCWFAKLPLFAKTVVVTRDAEGNAAFAAKIAARGGKTIEAETIKIKTLMESNAFLQALRRIKEYGWAIFTSANGVRMFFEAVGRLEKDARCLAGVRVAAIGAETARALEQFGIRADFVPSIYTSRELARELMDFADLRGRKIVLFRSQLGSAELAEILGKAGAEVEDVAVYTLTKNTFDAEQVKTQMTKGRVDWVTFASPFAAECFVEQIGEETVKTTGAKVASIGPVTSEKLRQLGVQVETRADEHTIDGLIAAIEQVSVRQGGVG